MTSTRSDDLRGKAVLITGGSSGIGAALARAFAAQGASLALHFNSHEAEVLTLADELAKLGGGRVGLAEDCVGSFLFLASNDLSGYITGNMIHVNGGMYMP